MLACLSAFGAKRTCGKAGGVSIGRECPQRFCGEFSILRTGSGTDPLPPAAGLCLSTSMSLSLWTVQKMGIVSTVSMPVSQGLAGVQSMCRASSSELPTRRPGKRTRKTGLGGQLYSFVQSQHARYECGVVTGANFCSPNLRETNLPPPRV
jgi:hypothetical protein